MVMLKVRLVADTGYAIGQTNDGGVRLMDWAVGKGMNLMNHFFGKTPWNPNAIVVKTGLN